MSSRSAIPTALPSSTAERRGSPRERSGQARDTATDHVACRPLSGLAYAARCHAGQRRESDGAPFIEHLSEVARLLRDAGCADVLVAAGLLHSVLQDTDISALADEIRRERARVGALRDPRPCTRLPRALPADACAGVSREPGDAASRGTAASAGQTARQRARPLPDLDSPRKARQRGTMTATPFAADARAGTLGLPPSSAARNAPRSTRTFPYLGRGIVGPIVAIAPRARRTRDSSSLDDDVAS